MTERQYVYKITEVVKVTDGDTYWLRVDVGFRQENLINVRLAGYDCPEIHSGSIHEKTEGVRAREVALTFLHQTINYPLWVRTEKDPDNFGRWLGNVWAEMASGDLYLGNVLRERELASVWPTRWREEYGAA